VQEYVDDYEANVPFRALAGGGCRVEAACPTKRKGESVVTVSE
jgi:D-lactate dehydratase